VGRDRYRRRHPAARHKPAARRRPPSTSQRIVSWGTAAVAVVFVLWFIDARAGLLGRHGSPLLAMLVDSGLVTVVALALAIRARRREKP
jgi:hypothetical protein